MEILYQQLSAIKSLAATVNDAEDAYQCTANIGGSYDVEALGPVRDKLRNALQECLSVLNGDPAANPLSYMSLSDPAKTGPRVGASVADMDAFAFMTK